MASLTVGLSRDSFEASLRFDNIQCRLLALALGRDPQDGANGVRHLAALPDHATHVVRRNRQFEPDPISRPKLAYGHLVRVIDKKAGNEFDELWQAANLRARATWLFAVHMQLAHARLVLPRLRGRGALDRRLGGFFEKSLDRFALLETFKAVQDS